MPQTFNRIIVFGRQRHINQDFLDTLNTLKEFLQERDVDILLETGTAQLFKKCNVPTIDFADLQESCDLVIVVGGDGSLLQAARAAVHHNLPILGINRGRLGFLTDVIPSEIKSQITDILDGKYKEENRFLLETNVVEKKKTTYKSSALNDAVLLPGDVAHMIEFDIHIDDELVCSQRADGLIVATPTGSTAYALSGGGPILHPSLDAIVLVPMFPHTLTSRPIVVEGNRAIKIVINKNNETSPQLSCDGQQRVSISPGSVVNINKKADQLRLIHPLDYNYYETLRSKLSWQVTH